MLLNLNIENIGINVMSEPFEQMLENKYQTSLAKLLPIKDLLNDTDRLLDQVIYKIYGLTSEETIVIGKRG